MDSIKDLAFEEALAELEALVRRLEGEDLSLDKTVELYQRGRLLAQHCQTLLDTVALQVEQLSTDPDGTVRVEPFAPEDASAD